LRVYRFGIQIEVLETIFRIKLKFVQKSWPKNFLFLLKICFFNRGFNSSLNFSIGWYMVGIRFFYIYLIYVCMILVKKWAHKRFCILIQRNLVFSPFLLASYELLLSWREKWKYFIADFHVLRPLYLKNMISAKKQNPFVARRYLYFKRKICATPTWDFVVKPKERFSWAKHGFSCFLGTNY
jgi:hypothetical protein